jgi:hypothetical protein
MVRKEAQNWLDVLLRGATSPKPPELGSDRIKELAGRGLLKPRSLSEAEIQEISAAIISHLVAMKAD